ncbi:SDR family NAD(P)-dependent oxidoreductase [Hyalangium versicolor]|uniref:SDR family NAD(P)-dependent oxidoreductase n=1 Tax=Hyalangium versicolor TaxID=2861190 RepID=UPI001CCF8EF8|nr:SDR family NAD(P)-dependent oxidoreductase [Hyalangium versicolor]
MKPTIVVAGHGPGISDAVARRFGKEGFAVALVARNAQRLKTAADALSSAGITAKAFACDLGTPNAVRSLIRDVRASLGPVAIIHWNPYTPGAGDLTTAPAEELHAPFDVSVTGLVAAVQEALPDLKKEKGAILVTGGGLAFYDPQVDQMAVGWQSMGLAISKAAQHKTVGLLHAKLAGDGVYVGEVVVTGLVKGTAWDNGNATLEPADIAGKFWDLYKGRTPTSITFP